MAKRRLDVALTELGLAESRQKAQAVIMAGEVYVEKAHSILLLNSQLDQELDDLASMRRGSVRVGTTAGRADYQVSTILPRFARRYPGVRVLLSMGHTEQLLKMIFNNELDIVLSNYDGEQPALDHEFIGEEELVLAARTGWWQEEKQLPLERIPLHPVSKSEELIYAFDAGDVSLVEVDLMATSAMGFGGVGESGMGAYHGRAGFEAFSHDKSIVDKKTWMDLPMRYQPYQKKLYGRLLHMFLR